MRSGARNLPSGNLFVGPSLVTLLLRADPYATFQHPSLNFLYFLSGEVSYRCGARLSSVKPGDSPLFEATALHGIERGPVSCAARVSRGDRAGSARIAPVFVSTR